MHAHLLIESFDPTLEVFKLFGCKIGTIIQRPIEVLCQHFLIEALTSQTPRGVPAGEVLIGTSRSVEVASTADVVDFTPNSQVDGTIVLSVVFEQCARGEGLEDDGFRALGQLGRLAGS